jgi:chromosome segregation ATPase
VGSPLNPTGSVENLEKFVQTLTDTIAKVQDVADDLGAEADALAELEKEVPEQMGEVGSALDALLDEVETAHRDAEADVDQAVTLAHALGEERLQSLSSRVDEVEQAFHADLSQGRADADESFGGLEEEGFQALSAAIDDATREVDEARQASEGTLEDLGNKAGELQKEVESAETEALARVEPAIDALSGEDASELEQAASDAVSRMQGLSDDVESACEAAEGEVTGRYGEFRDAAQDETEDLTNGTVTVIDETWEAAHTSYADPLREALVGVEEQGYRELSEALEKLTEQLGEGQQTTTRLEPMVHDLEIAKLVIADIDELLKSM